MTSVKNLIFVGCRKIKHRYKMEQNSTPPQKKSNKTTIIIGVTAAILVVIIGYLYFQNKSEMQGYIDEMQEEKAILTYEYQDLATNFDSLQSNSDTLNIMLEQEREKIAQLIEEIQTVKATNSSKIREYKKQLTSMRRVLKSFVSQIDSLNQKNQELTEENIAYRKRVSSMQSSAEQLETEKEKLEQVVDIASKLETFNMEASTVNANGRKTTRLSRIDKIKICFTIQKNITAEVGEKEIFLRILRPDGALLFHSREDVFKYESDEIYFSSKRVIEYGGEEVDVCLYYKVDSGELTKGEYTADIFADERNIGTMTFTLK